MRHRPLAAYCVHLYTASGVVFVFLSAAELCSDAPDVRWVFAWLILTVLIDATDGPLARWVDVKRHAPRIDGRTIDDLVDYLTYTFIPLLLIWRMGWLPSWGDDARTAGVWVVPAMIASLFGFANQGAKQEAEGFFLGFPSYWNVVAFYVGWSQRYVPSWVWVPVLLGLAGLTVAPVRFIYPNLAPKWLRPATVLGAGVWGILLLACLPSYPASPGWLVGLSLIYPVFYLGASIRLDLAARRRARAD